MIAAPHPGSLLVVGFPGTSAPPRLKRLIQRERISGVILFRRNIESPTQLLRLTTALQKWAAPERLFIGIDQEGGRVQRLPKPFTQWPPWHQVGLTNSHEVAYRVGQAMAIELREAGVNLDFAPVLDVQTETSNPIIGNRALSDDPALVARLGLAYIHGLQDHGVIACGKHFPGHGDTSLDSHKALPVVDAPVETLTVRELAPFRHVIDNRIATLMTAHVCYPALDPDWPATLSPAIITGLLRRTMGFEGVVFSDDLDMKAIADHWTPDEAAVQAVQAGVDLLLVCSDEEAQDTVLEGLRRAAEQGVLPADTLRTSIARIQQLKERYLTAPPAPAVPSPRRGKRAATHSLIGCAAHRALAHSLAKPSVHKA